jgi:hypothetical protein
MTCNANQYVTNMQLREFKVRASNEKREWDNSPESLIIAYEDINTKQKITGERFPNIELELAIVAGGAVRALIRGAS